MQPALKARVCLTKEDRTPCHVLSRPYTPSACSAAPPYPAHEFIEKHVVLPTYRIHCRTDAPLAPQVADLLAAKDDWAPLYDTAVLSNNRVPAAALSYVDDLYVDYNLSMVGALRGTPPNVRSLPILKYRS